jgi:hypothetical protein
MGTMFAPNRAWNGRCIRVSMAGHPPIWWGEAQKTKGLDSKKNQITLDPGYCRLPHQENATIQKGVLMTIILKPEQERVLLEAINSGLAHTTDEALDQALDALRLRLHQSTVPQARTPEEIRAWLDELAALSDKIPPRPGDTFSREMIYQDHA